MKVRHRYRYDSGNQRQIKTSYEVLPTNVDPAPGYPPLERTQLSVYPGDFERSGMVRDLSMGFAASSWDVDTDLGSEAQYLIGGARIVWNSGDAVDFSLRRDIRMTYAVTDPLMTTSAVMDIMSGQILEYRTYHPTGAQETVWTQEEEAIQSEPNGFTGKEADDEVGLTYFGHRYLLTHLGRWASPDPLAIHAAGGGET